MGSSHIALTKFSNCLDNILVAVWQGGERTAPGCVDLNQGELSDVFLPVFIRTLRYWGACHTYLTGNAIDRCAAWSDAGSGFGRCQQGQAHCHGRRTRPRALPPGDALVAVATGTAAVATERRRKALNRDGHWIVAGRRPRWNGGHWRGGWGQALRGLGFGLPANTAAMAADSGYDDYYGGYDGYYDRPVYRPRVYQRRSYNNYRYYRGEDAITATTHTRPDRISSVTDRRVEQLLISAAMGSRPSLATAAHETAARSKQLQSDPQ